MKLVIVYYSFFIFSTSSPVGIRGTFSPVLGVKLWNHILIKNNKGDDETIFQ